MKKMRYNTGKPKAEGLIQRMRLLGVSENDIDEKFILSSGKGGQHINKVSTAVFIRHKKSGIRIKCGSTRSQSANRFLARKRLTDRIECLIKGDMSRLNEKITRIRRQKRKRSQRSKLKLLKFKTMRARKKTQRRLPAEEY
ncbi:MAG: peptide chain release factor-like protein [Candidatus Omnitrophota bacterium]